MICVYADGEDACLSKFYDGSDYRRVLGLYSGIFPLLVQNDVIHLHASYIIHDGKAILFTGPSGIGKTTHAELWQAHQGALIVNGDVALIRKVNGQYCAFGVPVCGSSPYCENISAPISAVFLLEKADENSVCVINNFDAVGRILKEVYRPELSEYRQNILFRTLDDFMNTVPVFLLKCRPDKDELKQ